MAKMKSNISIGRDNIHNEQHLATGHPPQNNNIIKKEQNKGKVPESSKTQGHSQSKAHHDAGPTGAPQIKT